MPLAEFITLRVADVAAAVSDVEEVTSLAAESSLPHHSAVSSLAAS